MKLIETEQNKQRKQKWKFNKKNKKENKDVNQEKENNSPREFRNNSNLIIYSLSDIFDLILKNYLSCKNWQI